MGKLKEWVGSALLAQPFYVEELRMIGLLAPALCLGFMGLVYPRGGYRWRGAAIQRKINI
ncbi:hypothetical protein [Sphingomonas sp. Ant20]|uniref:hypothetical protein n=1 Tax=Sphingomonas sp. Ant20 TaxID=104605 RepID=UPI0005388841|nr:hypothetical protein [Sphingomonas sp. Ant20]KHA65191.1 hypothetical protein NI18_03765 [Sphingomonas sp. Ant20]